MRVCVPTVSGFCVLHIIFFINTKPQIVWHRNLCRMHHKPRIVQNILNENTRFLFNVLIWVLNSLFVYWQLKTDLSVAHTFESFIYMFIHSFIYLSIYFCLVVCLFTLNMASLIASRLTRFTVNARARQHNVTTPASFTYDD